MTLPIPGKKPIYLDYHSTTPCDPRVVDEMVPVFLDDFGNPSSEDHLFGKRAERLVGIARERVAQLIHARPEEIIFTSGTTEANHLALLGFAKANADKGRHILSARTEHKAVLEPLEALQREGFEISWARIDSQGVLDVEDLEKKIRKDTILISLMHGNNEIGTLHPLADVAKVAAKHGVCFHSDAAQTVGRERIEVHSDAPDLMSFSAHKIYGPKGVGALFIRLKKPRLRLEPWLYGGGQERGLRSSTLNVPGIVGMGKAFELARAEFDSHRAHVLHLRERFLMHLSSEVKDMIQNGHPTMRVSHNLSLTIPGIGLAKDLIRIADIGVSTGSSCASASLDASHVLRAIGLEEAQALSTLRVSFGKFLTESDVSEGARILAEAVHVARQKRKHTT